MSGKCEDCKNEKTCRSVCGIMFGFCDSEFEPKKDDEHMEGEQKMNATERIKMVKAMEFICRQINDEEVFMPWLEVGVADGDIEYGDLSETDKDGTVDWYLGEVQFSELMACFLRRMAGARKSGGLYCDGVVSAD